MNICTQRKIVKIFSNIQSANKNNNKNTIIIIIINNNYMCVYLTIFIVVNFYLNWMLWWICVTTPHSLSHTFSIYNTLCVMSLLLINSCDSSLLTLLHSGKYLYTMTSQHQKYRQWMREKRVTEAKEENRTVIQTWVLYKYISQLWLLLWSEF